MGEVNSGKTQKTLQVLRELLECREEPMAVLDLAPEKVQGVGGKIPLSPGEKERIFYLAPRIVAPRLSAKSEEEIETLAQENAQQVDEFLGILTQRIWQTLIINDVSLYLHARKAGQLMEAITAIPTLVMNGYYGSYFGMSPFSLRERERMEILISLCDQAFYVPAGTPPTR